MEAQNEIGEWTRLAVELLVVVKSTGYVFEQKTAPPVASGEAWILFADALAVLDEKRSTWTYFRCPIPANGVAQAYIALVSNNTFRNSLPGWHVTKEYVIGLDVVGICRQMIAKLSEPAALSGEDGAALLEAIWDEHRAAGTLESELRSLVDGGFLFHHLAPACLKPGAQCALGLLTLFATYPADWPASPNPGSAAEGRQRLNDLLGSRENDDPTAEALVRLCVKHDRRGILRQLIANPLAGPFGGTCIRIAIADGSVAGFYNAEGLVEDWPALVQSLRPDPQDEAIQDLIEQVGPEFIRQVLRSKGFLSDLAGLYGQVLPDSDDGYFNWLNEGLLGLSTDDWFAHLLNGHAVINLVDDLSASHLELGSKVGDAIYRYAEALASGSINSVDSETLSILIKGLASVFRAEFQTRLWSINVVDMASIPDLFFEQLGDELSAGGALRTDGALLWFAPLISAKHTRGVQWTADALRRHPEFLRHANDSNTEALRRRAEEAAKDGGDEAWLSAVEELRSVLS